jgi:hypothetical protein
MMRVTRVSNIVSCVMCMRQICSSVDKADPHQGGEAVVPFATIIIESIPQW